jgi:hypothetical protein
MLLIKIFQGTGENFSAGNTLNGDQYLRFGRAMPRLF